MSYERLPIVGVFFGPQHGSPSPALIGALAVGTPLWLVAEPDNPADINAIAVYVKSADLPEAGYGLLEEALPQFGFSLEQILAQEEWHLGYIPKNFAAQLREMEIVQVSVPVEVTFGTNPKGDPRVIFAEPVL
jgi:hypothetical protein